MSEEMDTEDIIDYFADLRRGYDPGLLAHRINDLNSYVESGHLPPEDFNRLFRIWLELDLPIRSWIKLGACLVPVEPLGDNLVRYCARWLLTGLQKNLSASRLGFLLTWLTAALDHEMVNAKELDNCYIIFLRYFEDSRHANKVAKLLYKLTKPHDVTRYWTQNLFKLLRTRNAPRDKAHVTVLLNLYKSYKPECVPESIQTVSVDKAFPESNSTVYYRFQRMKDYRNNVDSSTGLLKWHTDLRAMGVLGRGIKVRPLVPNMEFINLGSQLYSGATEENLLHFNKPTDALVHCLKKGLQRPTQIMSMLCNEVGALLLCLMPKDQHEFFSHHLMHTLDSYFLREDRVHRIQEKEDFLYRVARLQRIIMQAIPVVSYFLSKYMPVWDGYHYFDQICVLLEWVQPQSALKLRKSILEPLERIYCTVPLSTRLILLRVLTTMYNNMAYSNSRSKFYFLDASPSCDYGEGLAELAKFIHGLCVTSLRRNPANTVVVMSVLSTYEALAQAELTHAAPVCSVLPPPAVALALATPSAHSLNCVARVILMERKVFIALRSKVGPESVQEQARLILGYKNDLTNCLWLGTALSDRREGLLFNLLPDQSVRDLLRAFPESNQAYTIKRSLALAPYTYLRCEDVDVRKASNELWLENVVKPEFKDLGRLIEKMLKARAQEIASASCSGSK